MSVVWEFDPLIDRVIKAAEAKAKNSTVNKIIKNLGRAIGYEDEKEYDVIARFLTIFAY